MEPENRLDPELVAGPPPTRPARALKSAAAVCTFGLTLVAVIWAAVWLFLHNEYTGHIEAQKRQNENLLRVLEERTAHALAAVDQTLLRVKQRAEARRRDTDLDQVAAESSLTPAVLAQLAVLNRSGAVVADTAPSAGSDRAERGKRLADHSARDYFRALMARDSGQIFIGAQTRGHASGRFVLPVARRLNAADGSFDGAVVASIDPASLARSYGRLELGRDGVVYLAALDGSVRAAGAEAQDHSSGSPTSLQVPHLGDAAALSSSGSYLVADDVERIYSFRKLADYPLIIAVGTSVNDALGTYESDRRIYTAFAAVFSAVILIAALSLIFSFDRLLSMAAALRASEAKAHNENRAKSEFLAGFAQEMRTPLASIRRAAELLERRLDQPGSREQAGIVRRAAERLDSMLGDVLDVSRIEAGALEIARTPTDIRALVTETIEGLRPMAVARGLAFNLEVDVDVPARASWDAARVGNILGHLLSDAIELTAAGEVSLHVGRHGDRIVLTVADTGAAVPAAMREALFERMRGPDSQVPWDHGSAVLGLALSCAFAQLMGGELTVAPASGAGARFILALPIGGPGESQEWRRLPLAA